MLLRLLRSMLGGTPPPSAAAGTGRPPAEQPRFSYAADGLWTMHNADFLHDPLFRESYALGAHSGHRICAPEDLHIEWRVYVCCWAARHALGLPGDFVECGVSTGIVSRAVAHYTGFGGQDRRFWLVDTFEGIPLQQAADTELPLARSKNARHYHDCYDDVKMHFSRYGNVEVVRGRVPEVLATLPAQRVAYLHIDMNIAEPEVRALEHFWERMAAGGIVVFDDYGSLAHEAQKAALDAFAASRGFAILSLPTGQGLALKNR